MASYPTSEAIQEANPTNQATSCLHRVSSSRQICESLDDLGLKFRAPIHATLDDTHACYNQSLTRVMHRTASECVNKCARGLDTQ